MRWETLECGVFVEEGPRRALVGEIDGPRVEDEGNTGAEMIAPAVPA